MDANKINNYVEAQVKAMADRKVMPLVEAIKEEIASQSRNNDKLTALQAQVAKDNAESDKRIAEYQKQLTAANSEVNALAVKLAEATAVAASTGQE